MHKVILIILLLSSICLASPRLSSKARKDLYGFKQGGSGNLYHPSKRLNNKTTNLYARKRMNNYKFYSSPKGVTFRTKLFGAPYSVKYRF